MSEQNENDIEVQLLHRARTGDYHAFTSLVIRFQPRVYSLAHRIVLQAADAEDVVQQTFLSMIEHLDSYNEEGSVAAWILRIATNHSLKILRNKHYRHEIALESVDSADRYSDIPHPDFIAHWRDTPEKLAQQHEIKELLDEALADLDEKYRIIFVLRDLEGFSIRETANMTGVSEASVKVRLLRARLQLRERLTLALGDETNRFIPTHSHGASE